MPVENQCKVYDYTVDRRKPERKEKRRPTRGELSIANEEQKDTR